MNNKYAKLLLAAAACSSFMLAAENKQSINTTVDSFSVDKQKVGQIAAQIREKRPPEPYHGKGVKYSTEVIRRKASKKSGK